MNPSDIPRSPSVIDDPFGTAELRRRVLDAWRDSPARFRADANLEDDLALVGYRDRVVVELAQNAADAATRAAAAGRLALRLDGALLVAANTGAPLDAAGVESIAVARASAKRDHQGSVGRFGVGFGAVMAVSDEPVIASTTGAVRWSRADSRAELAVVPELDGEIAARDGAVPVLRLPFPAAADPASGCDTEVRLPLRDDAAVDLVRAQLTALDSTILLSLPGLAEIVIDLDGTGRTLRREDRGQVVMLSDGSEQTYWTITTHQGRLDPELLIELPVEERGEDTWSVLVAVPVTAQGRPHRLPAGIVRAVRAPTPTDDPMTIPVVLIASYPLDSSRRRVTTGSLADAITRHAAVTIVDAIRDLPADPGLLAMVPTGVPDGEIDGALHAALRGELQAAAWLPMAAAPDIRQRPRDAVAVPDPLVEPLASVVAGVLPAGWSGAEVTSLGASRPTIPELVDAVAGVTAAPTWWHSLYDGFAEAVPAGPERDALAALAVVLADGSVVTGPRGVAMPDSELADLDLGVLGIRVVHPRASHPLLRAVGAVDAGARGLLELPQVEQAVAAAYDGDDPGPVVEALLGLVTAAATGCEELPWLADLPLMADDGEWRPAGELLLPGGAMAAMVADDSGFATVAPDAVDRWGAETLRAVGVLDLPAVLRELDATGPDHDLDDEAGWWARLPAGAAVGEFVAVRDLEQLRDAAFGAAIGLLSEPPLRGAVVEPTLVSTANGSHLRVPSYTAWWLSSRPVLEGQRPIELRLAGSDPSLHGLYDEAPRVVDEEMLRALGVIDSIDATDPADLLDRLADGSRTVDRESLRRIYRHLADCDVPIPSRVRAIRDGSVVVVAAADAVVVDVPDLLPLLGSRAVVPVELAAAPSLAERLDLPLASELAAGRVVSTGYADGGVTLHDRLEVEDADGVIREVPWRLSDGELHVAVEQRAFGLGRGTAWRDGRWHERHRRTEELGAPEHAELRAAEDDLEVPLS